PGGPGGGMPARGEGGPGSEFMRGMMGGMGGAANSNLTPNGLERLRYLDRTDQVRHMAIGMVLVVDQAHIQDVLRALANSRLRFQPTQYDWTRCHGVLGTEGGVGMPGGSFRGGEAAGAPMGPVRPGMGGGPGRPASPGGPGGPGGPGPGGFRPGPGGFRPG